MFTPFISDEIIIKKKGDIISVSANLGLRSKSEIRKIIGNDKKVAALFNKLTLTGFEFYEFFMPEVIGILRELTRLKYPYQVNIPAVEKLMNELEKFTAGNKEPYEIDYKNINNRMEFKILPHQMKIFHRYEDFKNNFNYRGMLIDADPGTGKAQPLSSKVLTPNGWVKMGDIKEGDTVLTWRKEETKVLKVFPQGEKEIYTITFEDGRSTRCCKEHLWAVVGNTIDSDLHVMSLEELMSVDYTNYSIPLVPREIDRYSEESEDGLYHIYKPLHRILNGENFTTIKVLSDSLTKHIKELVRRSGGICYIEQDNGYSNITIDYRKATLKIKSIEKSGIEEAQCILIEDDDHLYITDDYIVTHNTFSSLALSVGLRKSLTIIICPLNTSKEVWVDSIAGVKGDCVFKEPQPYWMIKDNNDYKGEEFIICHYEALEKLYAFLKTLRNLDEICFIIDESHNLASADSKRTQLAIECINYVSEKANHKPEVFLLSGTPLKSSFREMINISKFIDPTFTKYVEKRFLIVYKSPNEYFSQLLTSRYTGYSVKVTKDSLGLEEPITQYINIKLPNGDDFTLETISRKLREFYNTRLTELKDNYGYYFEVYTDLKNKAIERNPSIKQRDIDLYEKDFNIIRSTHPSKLMFLGSDLLKNCNLFEKKLSESLTGDERKMWVEAKTIVKYPELKVQGEALGKIITGNRILCHAEMARNLTFSDITNTTTKKTVIFSSYVSVCQEAHKKCISERMKPIGVYGESVKDLNDSVNKFTNDPKTNPIIATYKSLSTGVPLIAGNVVICLDMPFRMYIYNQAISRVWRLGQDKQVYIYILSLDTGDKPNINSRNLDIITFFKNEIEKITGYKSNIDLDSTTGVALEDYRMDDSYKKSICVESKSRNIFDIWS